MPCNSIQTNTVDLGKMDTALLTAALAAMGLNPLTNTITGTIQFSGGAYDKASGTMRGRNLPAVNEVKQAYSAQVVLSTAKKFGWQVKETGKYQYQVTKR